MANNTNDSIRNVSRSCGCLASSVNTSISTPPNSVLEAQNPRPTCRSIALLPQPMCRVTASFAVVGDTETSDWRVVGAKIPISLKIALPVHNGYITMHHQAYQQLQIASYDPRWVGEFESERERIAHALGTLARRIDHNGSTAVPGLDAKPIIDIQVSVNRLRPAGVYAEPFVQLGYVHIPYPDDAVCPFFYRPLEWPHTHHIKWFNSAERRNAARWHSAISCASTGMWRGNMPSSKNSLPPESMPQTLPLAKHMRMRRPGSSSASFGSPLRRATHTAYEGLPLLL